MNNAKSVVLRRNDNRGLRDFIMEEDQKVIVSKLSIDIKNTLIYSLLILVIMFGLTTIQLSSTNSILKRANYELSYKYASVSSSYTELKASNSILTDNFQTLDTKYREGVNQVEKLTEIVNTLNDENIQLAEANDKYYSELTKFTEREELFNKYEYTIYNGTERTDITYDQLQLAEDLMIDNGLDPNLLLGIVMTESGGNEKADSASSTASGYGQFLSSTGNFVYEDLLQKNDIYNHSKALDGNINIEMMAAYLKYLYDKTGDVYSTIYAYRGVYNCSSYINKIDSYIGTVGDSIQKINSSIS